MTAFPHCMNFTLPTTFRMYPRHNAEFTRMATWQEIMKGLRRSHMQYWAFNTQSDM